MNEFIEAVRGAIASRRLSLAEAADEIGVTGATLKKHLAGEYLRSDSAAKYRSWLAGSSRGAALASPQTRGRPSVELGAVEKATGGGPARIALPPRPLNPLRVVDLFSGCGGLSLGYELVDQGAAFDTVLAVDIEPAMLEVLDDNRCRTGRGPVGRRVDLSDLTGEAEALAFYLDHLIATQPSAALKDGLDGMPLGSLASFKKSIRTLDSQGVSELRAKIRESKVQQDVRRMSADSFRQTSVLSFHAGLALPSTGSRVFDPPLLWWDDEGSDDVATAPLQAPARLVRVHRRSLATMWDSEVSDLHKKAAGRGGGQLASSSRRIGEFLALITSEGFAGVREAWLTWRSQRDALREWYFSGSLRALREVYEPWQVAVVVGGPPCQGFSRIGRGKIRSLRDSGVQARVDEEAGDARNRLLFAYVLMVSALRPSAFVFENVRHFQSEVHTPEGVFRAPEVLAEAIREISSEDLTYGVASRIVKAAEHGVPQTRERFFMAGIREGSTLGDPSEAARSVLALEPLEPVPLGAALSGLGQVRLTGDGAKTADLVDVGSSLPGAPAEANALNRFFEWVRRNPDGSFVQKADAHIARSPRPDDAAWFQRMAPGSRWLDYRVGGSETLKRLSSALQVVGDAVAENADLAVQLGVDLTELRHLQGVSDGSLALRLLLEVLPLGEGELQHHLLSETYLRKGDGNHGDWLARLAADRPCKTITSHMGKDTYAYVHPFEPRTLSVREAARVQTFPDWFSFGTASLVDAFRIVGNAVPPLLSHEMAVNVLRTLRYDTFEGSFERVESEAS